MVEQFGLLLQHQLWVLHKEESWAKGREQVFINLSTNTSCERWPTEAFKFGFAQPGQLLSFNVGQHLCTNMHIVRKIEPSRKKFCSCEQSTIHVSHTLSLHLSIA